MGSVGPGGGAVAASGATCCCVSLCTVAWHCRCKDMRVRRRSGMERLYDGMTQLVAWAAGWGVRHETLLENCNENKTFAGDTALQAAV